MTKISGFVFYRGPSMLDGAPIVAILTGLKKRSKNEKTGNGLFQTWIMREDINPLVAVQNGADYSICGDCKHRGHIIMVKKTAKTPNGQKNVERSCYVRLDTAPNNIWKSYRRGIYPTLPMNAARALIAGGKVRGGSYGDPATVPYHVWNALQCDMESGTAYTHQWRNFPELASFCMASVDTATERAQAKLLGFRTFRVRREHEPLEANERACPASAEKQYRTTCDVCLGCGGRAAREQIDRAIIVHGSGKANHFAVAQTSL